jgi:hypothetical protein
VNADPTRMFGKILPQVKIGACQGFCVSVVGLGL